MAERVTIYLNDDTAQLVAAREQLGRSATIARMLGRYQEICRRRLPELSRDEWCLIADSLNGALSDPPQSVAWSIHGIEDSVRLDQIDAKWSVDWPALRERLQALDYAQLVAVVDLVERFWAAVSAGGNPDSPLDVR